MTGLLRVLPALLFCLMPEQAHAVPFLAIFATSLAAGAIYAGALSLGVILGAAAITAVSYVTALLTKPDAFRLNLGLDNRTSLVRIPSAPRRVVYGRCRLSPQILSLNSAQFSSTNIRYLDIVAAICDHPLGMVRQVNLGGSRFLNDNEIDQLNAGQLVQVNTTIGNDPGLRNDAVNNALELPGDPPAAQIAVGLSGTGDFRDRMSALGLNPIGGGDWSDFKCTGMSWIFLRLTSTADRTKLKPFNNLPEIDVQVERAQNSLATFTPNPGSAPTVLLEAENLQAEAILTAVYPAGQSSGLAYSGQRASWNAAGVPFFDLFQGSYNDGFILRRPLTQSEIDVAPHVTIDGVEMVIAGIYLIAAPGIDAAPFHVIFASPDTGADWGGNGPPPSWRHDAVFPDNLYFAIGNDISNVMLKTASQNHSTYLANHYWKNTDFFVDDQRSFEYFAGLVSNSDNDKRLNFYIYTHSRAAFDLNEITSGTGAALDNAAVCCHDYLKRYTSYGGTLFGESLINDSEVSDAVEIAQQRGWTADGAITLDDSPDAVLSQFEQALIGGFVIDRAGEASMRAGGPAAPSFHITENMVLADWVVTPSLPRIDRASIHSVEYADTDGLVRTSLLKNTPAVAELGERIVASNSLFINTRRNASQLSRVVLSRQWESFRLDLRTNASAIGLGPGDTCLLTLPRLGIEGKKFRVISSAINPDLSINFELYEEDDRTWDILPEDAAEFTPESNANITG